MRIVTWNCFRGDLGVRSRELEDLSADILVLQECAEPGHLIENALCFGTNPRHCLGMIAQNGYVLERVGRGPHVEHTVFPARVRGPLDFNLLAIWAQREPTYVDSIMKGLDAYCELAAAGPTIVIGDFNSHTHFDQYGGPTHQTLVDRLQCEFGLVSAYHSDSLSPTPRLEVPTHFWQWKQEAGFHIDYCFIPESWVGAVREVRVVDEPAGSRKSDHRPLLVDIAEDDRDSTPGHVASRARAVANLEP
jgi:hypothetical protein